jgi:hypothetical protein
VHLHGIPLGMFKSMFLGRVYSGTRMDTIWSFREGQDLCAYVRVATLLMLFRFFARYNTARKIKESQDQYCSKAIAGHWDDLGEFPEDLQWEALVDVLRGRVKVKYLSVLFETIVFDGLAYSDPNSLLRGKWLT